LKSAFGWTQYEGHGPGDELLGDPATALELGSGRGNAVAALATKGIDATGVDISPAQCERARKRWGHLPGARYVHGDVVDRLARAGQQWEAIYSIHVAPSGQATAAPRAGRPPVVIFSLRFTGPSYSTRR
jgi:SAM-dependent methyltransferase